MTTKTEISGWFDHGLKNGFTHMIVVCDTFDYDDYPVYAKSDADALTLHKQYTEASMQRVMEVYDIRMDKAAQMAEKRANHLPTRAAAEIGKSCSAASGQGGGV